MQLFLDLSVLEHIYFLPWLYTCPLVIKLQYSSSTSLSFSFGKFSTFLPIFLCLLSLEFILLVKNMFFHVSLFLNVLFIISSMSPFVWVSEWVCVFLFFCLCPSLLGGFSLVSILWLPICSWEQSTKIQVGSSVHDYH